MYPPNGGQAAYSPLPDSEVHQPSFDIHDTFDASPPLKNRLQAALRHPLFRPIAIVFSFLFAVAIFKIFFSGQTTPSIIETPDPRPILTPEPDSPSKPKDMSMWRSDSFGFSTSERPAYLDKPLTRPLVLRLAIITRVDAFERRQTIRESVLAGVKPNEVQIDYRFFVGRAKDGVEGLNTKLKLVKENKVYNDVVILDQFPDVAEKLSVKRFEAFKWTNSIPYDQYDYSMTIDSDTFCRFSALARRLQHTHPNLNPRKEPIMVGRMGNHKVYYQNTGSDDNEDFYIAGPWYKYPIGVGYMLSSNVTQTLLSLDPPVAHHVNYPSDDVMIGSWIAALRYYPDSNATFLTTEHSSAPSSTPGLPVEPKPLLPYIVNTTVVDDQGGWHDIREESTKDTERPISWDSVCIHRMKIPQMKSLRQMDEIKAEWDEV
ncbi:hypothetical protein JR316_0008524 [Psilocybe cubensis]|uniref:Hexosyltransferase n=2 Tax=Psilocybe cubensis TaxID=181762 RepID=A0A8H7XJU4_PSICU|nr:hypothetical protein JR316_0008524 [Psilocybe cubensis]KAH9479928.1 hypothetical protein JR316_0008524 [Psilocybe cubensis]